MARPGTLSDRGETEPHGPSRALGILLLLLIPVLSIAPSLGALGTALRIGAAVVGAFLVLRKPRYPGPFVVFPILMLSGLMVAHAATAQAPNYSLSRMANWMMFVPLVLVPWERRLAWRAYISLLIAAALQAAGIALQFLGVIDGQWGGLLVSGSSYDLERRNFLIRYTGFVRNPNDLGLLLALASLVTLAIGLSLQRRVRRQVMFSLTVVLFVVATLTGSRGALIALGIGLLISVRFFAFRIASLAPLAVVGLFVGGVYFNLRPTWRAIVDSITSIVSGSDTSSSARIDLWEKHGQAGVTLFGEGFGTFAETSSGDGLVSAHASTVDNSWLKLSLELGVVGAAAMALILATAFVLCMSGRVASSSPALGLATGGAVAMIAWRSFSADILDINPWNAIIWLLIGAAWWVFDDSGRRRGAYSGENGRVGNHYV